MTRKILAIIGSTLSILLAIILVGAFFSFVLVVSSPPHRHTTTTTETVTITQTPTAQTIIIKQTQ